jgi:hypothetical protein
VPTVKRVKIYQGRSEVQGWNEIDAVGLIDEKNDTQWAVSASASSWYGQGPASGNNASVAAIVPSWSGLQVPTADWIAKRTKDETRVIDARGWPMVALWGEADPAKMTTAGVATSSTAVAYTSSFIPSGATIAYTGVSTPPTDVVVFPWHPVWIGFAVNTVLYAIFWGGLLALILLPRRFFIEVSRLRRGCCVACGYDIGYDFPRGCPECGWRRENQIHHGDTEARRKREELLATDEHRFHG